MKTNTAPQNVTLYRILWRDEWQGLCGESSLPLTLWDAAATAAKLNEQVPHIKHSYEAINAELPVKGQTSTTGA